MKEERQKPKEYPVSSKKFHDLLKKASRPTKKSEKEKS